MLGSSGVTLAPAAQRTQSAAAACARAHPPFCKCAGRNLQSSPWGKHALGQAPSKRAPVALHILQAQVQPRDDRGLLSDGVRLGIMRERPVQALAQIRIVQLHLRNIPLPSAWACRPACSPFFVPSSSPFSAPYGKCAGASAVHWHDGQHEML